jgi:hypothetical protein
MSGAAPIGRCKSSGRLMARRDRVCGCGQSDRDDEQETESHLFRMKAGQEPVQMTAMGQSFDKPMCGSLYWSRW